VASPEPPTGKFKSEAQKQRSNKRKVVAESLSQTREELFAGEFDGLIIASEYDPFSILQSLSPYLAGSASIVVHSPYVQVFSLLFHDFSTLTTCPDCGRFTESATRVASIPWAYRHGSVVTALSVLPGRTHPLMNMSGSGGFILHTTKVSVYAFDLPLLR
ncbi:eukaryotic translation initiation factor 3G, partial [Postia placenta Mad-698-R]